MSEIRNRVLGGVPRGQRLADAAAFWLLMCGLAWFGYTVSLPARSSELARVEAAFGIRVEKVKLAAGGYFLDFRYRVLDQAKASDLLHPGDDSYLMPEKAAVRLEAIQVPSAASSKLEDRDTGVAVAFFDNPGQLIKRGDRVTLVLGRFKASGLTVQ